MALTIGFGSLLAGFSMLAIIGVSDPALARPVRCAISGSIHFKGKCDFTRGGANFSLSPIGRASFPGGVNPVTVAIISPGVADVRGLTREGINSRWGEARRSKRDPACWEGADFRICAY